MVVVVVVALMGCVVDVVAVVVVVVGVTLVTVVVVTVVGWVVTVVVDVVVDRGEVVVVTVVVGVATVVVVTLAVGAVAPAAVASGWITPKAAEPSVANTAKAIPIRRVPPWRLVVESLDENFCPCNIAPPFTTSVSECRVGPGKVPAPAARLTQRVPWICVPTSRGVCLVFLQAPHQIWRCRYDHRNPRCVNSAMSDRENTQSEIADQVGGYLGVETRLLGAELGAIKRFTLGICIGCACPVRSGCFREN